jgi:hypothetical protein
MISEFKKPIPKIAFPSISKFQIDAIDEPLVSLRDLAFAVEPSYYNQGSSIPTPKIDATDM